MVTASNQERRAAWLPIVTVALVFLAVHLPYFPKSLEDLDSINFALGVRRFDVAEHQPHPPGYPLFIALAKAARPVVGSDVHALSIVSVIAGGLSIFALVVLFDRIAATAPARGATHLPLA